MANKVSTDKKEFAEALFMQGMPQNAIAEKVSVSANTVGKWVKDGCWGEKRAALSITRKSLQNELLSAIKEKIDELRNVDIFSSGKVVDQLVKLSATIERLDKEASAVDFIECFMAVGSNTRPKPTRRLPPSSERWSTSIRTSIYLSCSAAR